MTEKSSKIKKTVTKIADNKKAKQSDAESKTLQKLGEDMSAPNDKAKKGTSDKG